MYRGILWFDFHCPLKLLLMLLFLLSSSTSANATVHTSSTVRHFFTISFHRRWRLALMNTASFSCATWHLLAVLWLIFECVVLSLVVLGRRLWFSVWFTSVMLSSSLLVTRSTRWSLPNSQFFEAPSFCCCCCCFWKACTLRILPALLPTRPPAPSKAAAAVFLSVCRQQWL